MANGFKDPEKQRSASKKFRDKQKAADPEGYRVKINAATRAWRSRTINKRRSVERIWEAAYRERKKELKLKNRDRINAQNRALYAANPDRHTAYQRKYAVAHKDKIALRKKAWEKAHKDEKVANRVLGLGVHAPPEVIETVKLYRQLKKEVRNYG